MMRVYPMLALALALAAPPLAAAPCAGFSDVADTDSFCPSVEWLRNRAITLGCTATQYCPAAPVSRAAMALFMNRLGTALSSQVAFVELALGATAPQSAPVLCQSAPVAAAAYPRQALITAAFAGLADAALDYAVRPAISTDGGATWQPLGAVVVPDAIAGVAWGNSSVTGTTPIAAGQSVLFGMRLSREAGAGTFTQARCQLAANVMNANGASSPFDTAAAN